MGQSLRDIFFEDWLRHVFDHPVTDPEWYFDLDADWWAGPASITAEYLARCFENADTLLHSFSDAQLRQGLWYLADVSCSDHMFARTDPEVPQPLRQRAIRAMYDLFAQCYARLCTPHLIHRDELGFSEINLVCYMWWDILPIYGGPHEPDRADADAECLAVIERILSLDSDACRESALHGLGHGHMYHPQRVEEIIRGFLSNAAAVRPELRAYALAAQHGTVQ
jgi:hypothetical protein